MTKKGFKLFRYVPHFSKWIQNCKTQNEILENKKIKRRTGKM